MSHDISRRGFLQTTGLAAVALPLLRLDDASAPWRARWGSPPVPAIRVKPFALADIRLRPGLQLTALGVNRRFMTGLEADRLLHTFRLTAGQPSSAEPYGGWEAPDNELRGHFMGHYLSACALMWAQTGDEEIRHRGEHLVAELAKCQQPSGYLSAFPTDLFDRLRNHQRVWAPFYTYHKIMAGLLDSYTLAGNRQALGMVRGMADWTRAFVAPIPDAEWQKTLDTEFGGMSDLLYELSQVTGETTYADLAHRFDHERILAPLAAGRDELTNVHGNTNVPKVLGAARRYEITGEERARAISEYFWHEITGRRSYATGGSTNDEAWQGEPGHLSKALGAYTQETCVSYNMLKLTRQLFTWSPDAALADYYERAYFNGILPTQHPTDGEKLYYLPLASGYWKQFGTPGQDFWCCTGSGVENFSKLGDSVYFHDDTGIYVNLFVPSEVTWRDKGVRLVQDTTFPEHDTTALTVRTAKPVRMALRVRVPYWAKGGNRATLNGRAVTDFPKASGYLVVDRTWRDGDRLEMTLPMSLHVQPMPDDETLQAVMYGPLVLAGRMGTAGLTTANLRAEPTAPRTVPEFRNANLPAVPAIKAPSSDPSSWLEPVPGTPLHFRTVGQDANITFVPLYALFDERYGVYWKVSRA